MRTNRVAEVRIGEHLAAAVHTYLLLFLRQIKEYRVGQSSQSGAINSHGDAHLPAPAKQAEPTPAPAPRISATRTVILQPARLTARVPRAFDFAVAEKSRMGRRDYWTSLGAPRTCAGQSWCLQSPSETVERERKTKTIASMLERTTAQPSYGEQQLQGRCLSETKRGKPPHLAHPGSVGEALAELFRRPFSQSLCRFRPAFQSLPLIVQLVLSVVKVRGGDPWGGQS